MKVAMYVKDLGFPGGVERSARELRRIFRERGVEVFIFGEAGGDVEVPKAVGQARREAIRGMLARERPDVGIFHGGADEACWEGLEVFREAGVPTVGVCHFFFASVWLIDGDEGAMGAFLRGARRCTAVAAVSEVDAMWWRALGVRAARVRNPYVHPVGRVRAERGQRGARREVLWVGRVAQPKQPEVALRVFAGVLSKVPEAHLTMVGGTERLWRPYRRLARRLGIPAGAVAFLPAQETLGELWARADVHLSTSRVECSPLVLAEARAWGVPSVLFEMAWVELAARETGAWAVPMGDEEALREGVVKLLREEGVYAALQRSAAAGAERFSDEAVWESWERVFAGVRTGVWEEEAAQEWAVVAQEVARGWEGYCERNLWAVRLAREWQLLWGVSLRGVARVVGGAVAAARGVKRWMRGD